jgi:hypothetical protein
MMVVRSLGGAAREGGATVLFPASSRDLSRYQRSADTAWIQLSARFVSNWLHPEYECRRSA